MTHKTRRHESFLKTIIEGGVKEYIGRGIHNLNHEGYEWREYKDLKELSYNREIWRNTTK